MTERMGDSRSLLRVKRPGLLGRLILRLRRRPRFDMGWFDGSVTAETLTRMVGNPLVHRDPHTDYEDVPTVRLPGAPLPRHYSVDDGWHGFAPGIDMDDPDKPDPRWCNVCGETYSPKEN